MIAGERSSALYRAKVTHLRLRPVRHRLQYNVYYLLLDLDRIEAQLGPLKLLSWRRFNIMSFDERDHGAGNTLPLRAWVDQQLTCAGIDLQGGLIHLLTMPRVLGYAFNPISIYFCYHRNGQLRALLYEVRNTFGERHSYLIPVASGEAVGPVTQHCPKQFHVSPFLGMDMRYVFRVLEPEARLTLAIEAHDDQGAVIKTLVSGRHQALNDRALFFAFLATPLLTLKVIFGIHWEALKLWLKGMRLHRRPQAPKHPVTIVNPPLLQKEI